MKNKKINMKKLLIYGSILLVYSIILIIVTIVIVNLTSTSNDVNTIKESDKEVEKKVAFGNEIYNMTSYNDNIIQYKNWIIFSTGAKSGVFSNKLEGIYKYNINNGQVICLSDYNGSNFNIIGDTLYYINEFGQIYNVNLETNGGEDWIAWIGEDTYKAANLLMYGDDIYYTDSNGYNIYKTDKQGYKKDLIAEYTTGAFQIHDDYIYYRENETCKLYRKNIKNDSESELVLNEAIICYYVVEDKIIYRVGDTLKIYNILNNEENTIINNITSNFAFDKNCIYFYSSEAKAIKQYDIENGKEKNLIDNIENDIYIIQMYDNNIYYKINTYASRAEIYYYNIQENKVSTIDLNTNK